MVRSRLSSFIAAFDGVRCFGVFGSLYGARTKFAEFIATLAIKAQVPMRLLQRPILLESQWLIMDLQPQVETKPRPPSPSAQQLQLLDPTIDAYAARA